MLASNGRSARSGLFTGKKGVEATWAGRGFEESGMARVRVDRE
jgi:hypothetical protein